MRLVVADTSPIRYLIQIDEIDLLPRLFESVLIPSVVARELRHPMAPVAVRLWMENPPAWLRISEAETIHDPQLLVLDPGEAAAIDLALRLAAELIVIDDRQGTLAAGQKGLRTTGTLGVLELAAHEGLVDISIAIKRLLQTNFRWRPEVIDALVSRVRSNASEAP